MEPILHEFGSLLLRWAHIVTGMAWIGASFYFMHLDAALRPARPEHALTCPPRNGMPSSDIRPVSRETAS